MAESPVARLKRLAEERRAANAAANAEVIAAVTAPAPAVVTEPAPTQEVVVTKTPEPEPLPEPDSPIELTPPVTLQKSSRNHPLVREMEELEASLEQNVPGFVTILRDIHKKLAADPLTVTLLSLEERGTIVKGMTRHANITIATKTINSTSRAKKTPISADDL